MLLGCIADDFTGATDLGLVLAAQGLRVVQAVGVPAAGCVAAKDADAVIVALKSRTAPVGAAVSESLAALSWLEARGARRFLFKYCSTFDSTDRGNIGPVADALLDALGADFTIACPAYPSLGRTVKEGDLYVGDVLLSESGMRDHPLTPMTDSNLVRVLSRQTVYKVDLIRHPIVAGGAGAIRAALSEARGRGTRYAIIDVLRDDDLRAIAEAAADLTLITGGSGMSLGLAETFRRAGMLGDRSPPRVPAATGPAAVLSGSCSEQTRKQVAVMKARYPSFAVEPVALADGTASVEAIMAWAEPHLGKTPFLVYATAAPDEVRAAQDRLGRESAGQLIERTLASIARKLVARGARRLIVAGGETSGAVVRALNISALRIGPAIDPGVPWTETIGDPPLALALKSGNFGADDFFIKAFDMLP